MKARKLEIIVLLVFVTTVAIWLCSLNKSSRSIKLGTSKSADVETQVSPKRDSVVPDPGNVRRSSVTRAVTQVDNSTDPRQHVIELFRSDPQKAIRYANNINDENLRATLMGIIADVWAKVDADACFTWANSLSNPNDRSSALTGGILALISENKISKAVELIGNQKAGEFRDDMIVYGLSGIASKDIKTAVQLTSLLSGKGATFAASKVIASEIVNKSGLDGLHAILDDVPNGAMRESISLAVIGEIAKSDPEAAFQWFASNPGYSNIESLRKISDAFAVSDPLRGIDLASQIINPSEKKSYLSNLGSKWARKDPTSAGDWLIKSIEDGNFSEAKGAYEEIISESMQWQHEAVFDKLSEISDEKIKATLMLKAVSSFSKFDPKSAADRLGTDFDSKSKEQVTAITTIASNWLVKDPVSATTWVGGLSDGPAKNSAISEIVKNILSTDGDTAMATKWASTLTDVDQRKLAYARIAEEERKRN